MIQTVVNNFDADISSQNGRLSTYSMAMKMTQLGSSSSVDIDISETIQRTPTSDVSTPIKHEIDIERFQVEKKPQMAVETEQKQVLPLKLQVKMVVFTN
ncbi:hypothetical protein DPMN_149385 [Dreissena polymorpha]|uniref:Uncharacterized protein n=1 Tax=Dreissena polymorpha TaxID=45954 RepID=A0A9D4FDN9_DREPO|nr:hypothetical protein DPMN_149385 [Dreissena polymorpha]